MANVSIPKGTRDFGPIETAKRNYIYNTIKRIFTLYGYQQIETPTMENLSTLMGKYGDEGDKLLFKVLNSGNFLKGIAPSDINEEHTNKLATQLCEKGLRYDLTVPFARYVVQHRNEITLPFKRFQIQPVWRADRPQKGRYREFYQCDADIIGTPSLLNEIELIQIINDVFSTLGISVLIKMNNRKILYGIAEVSGQADKIVDITVAIDKLDKIGLDKVVEELMSKGIDTSTIEILKPFILLQGSTAEKIALLKQQLQASDIGMKGIAEVEYIFNSIQSLQLNQAIELDITLARGLNYYTGAIFEVKAKDVEIGSISGGGRYDDLTGIFGMPDMSGVGISFGADRIYDVLEQLNAFPETSLQKTEILFLNFGEQEVQFALPLVQQLRKQGKTVELYPDPAKLKKQMAYADAKGIEKVFMIGENEMNTQTVTIKHLSTGQQETIAIKDL